MTTLAITPNWKNKSAKFKGTVAAGEHVSVTILNEDGEGGEFIDDASTLRLRVVNPCNGRTLAIFPEPFPEGETPEEWDSDLSPLRCTLNLNTVQMLKAVPPAANVPLLWVLDDYENKTLYFKEMFSVEHWPRLRGEEEPTDLDNYKDLIADFDERLTAAEQTVADAATDAQSAANSASAAAGSAAAAATAATDAQTGAIASKNAAQSAATAAAISATNASTSAANAAQASSAAESARQAAATSAAAAAESAAAFVVDDTLSVEGAAADAKAVGEANQALTTQIGAVQSNLNSEVTARETLSGAVQVDRQNLAAEIARAQGAEQSLDNRKADKTTTYTKEEVDAAVAAATPSDYDSVKARLAAAEGKIPTQASAQNQLADKEFVNSSVATATATFRGTSDAATQAAFETWLDGLTADVNDYVFWHTTDAAGNAVFKRYKYDGAEWEWEFDLNNSSFTAEQWAAISSGITSGLVAKLGALPTAETLATALAGKQDALTFDNAPTAGSNNPVKSGGIWSAIWGALAALPTGFASLYDWCVAQFEGKASKADVDPLLFDQYYTDGSVKSAAEFTAGIKYDAPDTTNRTITVKPFCVTDTAANDNRGLVGRVVIPPFVDGDGNGYISDDGTRYKVVGVSEGETYDFNTKLTAIIAPNTVTIIGNDAFDSCTSLTSVYLPAATAIGAGAFAFCDVLSSVDFGDTARPSVPTLGVYAFNDVPTSCKIIVPYAQYDAWTAASGWSDLQQEFVRHAEKADKPATFTAGHLAAFDANGNPTDSTIPAANVALKGNIPYTLVTKTINNNNAVTLDDRATNAVAVSLTIRFVEINFPTAPTGKLRDFAMRLNIAAGVTAPEILWPQGVTLENNGGEIPEIADGGTGGSSTILYFSETENNGTTAKFLVKGETLTAIAQA